MSDDKVVSLEEFKNEKKLEEGAEAHEMGEAFHFEPFELDDGELPNGVGITECDEHPICMLLNKEKLTGISMSLETAERLTIDLLAAIKEVREHREKEGA